MTSDAVSVIRKYLGSLSYINILVMALRSVMLKLLEFLTNLDQLPSSHLVVGTPSLSLLQAAVLDLVYGYSRGRSGNFLLLVIFPF